MTTPQQTKEEQARALNISYLAFFIGQHTVSQITENRQLKAYLRQIKKAYTAIFGKVFKMEHTTEMTEAAKDMAEIINHAVDAYNNGRLEEFKNICSEFNS
jgi:hypothetical protein